jgi:hypothetical protein
VVIHRTRLAVWLGTVVASPRQTCQQRVGLQGRQAAQDYRLVLQVPGDFHTYLGGGRGKNDRAQERELSSLVKWSQASGAIWLHMLLSSGFNDHCSFPFTQLRRHLGATEWAKREKEFDNAEELEAFTARKVSELDEYDEALEKREEDKALVDSGKMTKEEFIVNAL